MPTYEITSPDGKVFEINAPEGADEQAVMDFFKKNYQAEERSPDYGRIGSQMVGGVFGGTLSGGNPLGIGLGSAAGGQAYDLYNKFVLGREDNQTPLQRGITAAEDTMLDASSTRAFDIAAPYAKRAMAAPFRAVKSKLAGAGAKELAEDYAQAGIRPQAGPISGNRTIQSAEDFLSGNVAAGRTMQEAFGETAEDTARYAKEVASGYGPVRTAEGLGEVAKKGAEYAVKKFKDISEIAYRPLNEAIPDVELVDIPNTFKVFDDVFRRFASSKGSEKILNSRMNSVIEAIMSDASANKGKIPYGILKEWRSRIGDALKGKGELADLGTARLKQLYGALADDSKEIARGKGLSGRLDMADKYYKFMRKTQLPIFEKILKTETPEDTINLILKSSEKGGSRLRALRKGMTKDQWKEFSGTLLNEMGKAKPGVQDISGETFSSGTFLTNWSKMSKEAKEALWGGTGNEGLKDGLDRLLRIAASQKDMAKVLNNSNTGRINQFINLFNATTGGIAGAALGGPYGSGAGVVVGATGIPYVTAKLITNPKFVKWLADGAKIAASKPNNMGSHMARLVVLANEEGLKEELSQFLEN